MYQKLMICCPKFINSGFFELKKILYIIYDFKNKKKIR